MSAWRTAILRDLLTFLHIFSPLDALLDLFFIGDVLLASKRLMESCSEIVVTMRILPSHEEQIYLVFSSMSCCREV
jgi:hypothetical protein